MSGVQHLTVDEDGQDQRLDRWFKRMFPHISQGRIEKLCRKGEIRVEKGRVKPGTRLITGQNVRVPPLPDARDLRERNIAVVTDDDREMIQRAVLFKDEHFIVINKPAGLPTQGGTGHDIHVDMLAEELKFGEEKKPKLVHRLDKDTSGVLLLARTGRAAKALAKALQDRETRKVYWALVAGRLPERVGTIQYGLIKAGGHGPNGAGEKMHCIHPNEVDSTPGAKRATTDYAVIENIGTRATWVGLVPVTGRTHQLRAHMAEIGCPIVGDGKYGGNSQSNDGEGWGAKIGGDISRKMHLHARSIGFVHPFTGKEMFFEAPLPEHMARSWDLFGWNLKWAPKDPFAIFE
jgi:23S rRNA pseudouridine955/2504/2580 synthase